MEKRIYRIRRCSGFKGGSNFYHHADVIETHYMRALAAAHQGRVQNWRFIDSFDKSPADYREFEYLGRIDPSEAKRPKEPVEQLVSKKH